jgi:HEAT repeat protein
LLFVAGGPSACNKSQSDIDSAINVKLQEMMTKRTPQQRAMEAIQSEDPDQRRKLLQDVLKSKMATAEWAVKVFATIAKTDPDPQVRCMAIKGLRRSADDRVAEPLLMILNHKEYPKVTPPPPEVRWDATEVLMFMSDMGSIPAEHQDWARRTLLKLATEDPDRNVRICATHALGDYPNQDVLPILLQALEDRDFAVRYEAERALQKLTGERHDYDVDGWRAWLAQQKVPLATQPVEQGSEMLGNHRPNKNLLDRTRDLFLMWQEDKKEGTE